MKKTKLLLIVLLFPFVVNSQTLGGYTIYDYLISAVHPNGCTDAHVINLPDDSIWVNFNANDSMTGNFAMPSVDKPGSDLLLETGFHTSLYVVSVLLSNGQYSATDTVQLADWTFIQNVTWQYMYTSCGFGNQFDEKFIVPLDFNLDFGLLPSDTVTGIKIIFLASAGATDFAGAYIISEQQVGLEETNTKQELRFYPNPFTGYTSSKMNLNSNKNLTVKVFNMYGKEVAAVVNITASTIELHKGKLTNGIYSVQLWNNAEHVSTTKLVVQ